MSRLAERTVQEHSLQFLEKRYKKWVNGRPIYAQMEVRTKKKYGNKRADGLLAMRHAIWGLYVVSMEAKSIKTIASMKPYRDHYTLIWNSLLTGFFACVGSGAIFALTKMNDGYWQFLLPVNVWVITSLLYGFLTKNSYRHKVVKVIDQLNQYPANERWLAFSKDSYDQIAKQKIKQLESICRYQGVGILIVDKRTKVKIRVKAKMKLKWWRNFLQFYSKEKEIRKVIDL